MKHVAILDDYQQVWNRFGDWARLDGRVSVTSFADHLFDEAALAERLAPFEIIVAMRERTPFPASLLDRLDNLELLVTTGPFNAAIDIDHAANRGVVMCGTGGAIFNTSELTWALILACARRVPTEDRVIKSGGWMTTVGSDLYGKNLALCGAGRLGGIVAGVGKAFGMQVLAWSENLTDARASEIGAVKVDKDTLFREADVLSIHQVLSSRTRHLVGARELDLMKRSAILVNTSRGPIVDEAALAEALRAGQIAGAGIDVFEIEPLPADHPFRSLDNIVTTPHLGYVTEGCYEIFYRDIVEDIVAWLDGDPIRLVQPAPK